MATDEAYEAAGVAMVQADDDDHEHEYYEWHECIRQPHCASVARGEPCPCSGIPWPSPVVRAAVDAVRPIFVAEGRRQAAEAIRAVDVQKIADLEGDTARVGLTVAAQIAAGETP